MLKVIIVLKQENTRQQMTIHKDNYILCNLHYIILYKYSEVNQMKKDCHLWMIYEIIICSIVCLCTAYLMLHANLLTCFPKQLLDFDAAFFFVNTFLRSLTTITGYGKYELF